MTRTDGSSWWTNGSSHLRFNYARASSPAGLRHRGGVAVRTRPCPSAPFPPTARRYVSPLLRSETSLRNRRHGHGGEKSSSFLVRTSCACGRDPDGPRPFAQVLCTSWLVNNAVTQRRGRPPHAHAAHSHRSRPCASAPAGGRSPPRLTEFAVRATRTRPLARRRARIRGDLSASPQTSELRGATRAGARAGGGVVALQRERHLRLRFPHVPSRGRTLVVDQRSHDSRACTPPACDPALSSKRCALSPRIADDPSAVPRRPTGLRLSRAAPGCVEAWRKQTGRTSFAPPEDVH